MFRRVLEFLRILRPRKPRHGAGVNLPRSYGNANAAIHLINVAGYSYKDDGGRTFSLHKGERIVGGMWCVRSMWPEHNNAWIAGWYDYTKRRCYTVCNPNNYGDYSDVIEQHEVAHDLELQIGLTPPWHNVGWRHLFFNWRGFGPGARAEVSHGCVYDFVREV